MAPLPLPDAMAIIDKFTIHEKAGRSLGMIKHMLCLITCVDMVLLERSPDSEKKKYISLGLAMLLTTVLSFFSAYIAINYIYPEIGESSFRTVVKHLLAIVPSLVWMLIIFNLQRFVLSGSSRTSDSDRVGFEELVRALPSIVMSIVIGMVVAIPLEVAIFKPEIDIYLRIDQERRFLNNEKVNELRSRSNRLQTCTEFYRYQLNQELPLIRCIPRSNGELVLLQPPPPVEASSTVTADPANQEQNPEATAVERGDTVAASATPSIADKPAESDKVSAQEPAQRDPEPGAMLDALSDMAKQTAADRDQAIRQEEIDKLGGGLVYRSSALFEHMPYFAYSVMLLIIFVQLTPVLIKMMSPKSTYDYLSDTQNRLIVAVGRAAEEDETRRLTYRFDRAYGGIEVNAVAVYDELGQGKPVTLYHRVDEVEKIIRDKFSESNKELEERRLAEMRQRYRRLEKLTSTS